MKQVLVIHGGDSFPTYEDYVQFLKEFPITLEPKHKGWKSHLPEALGEEYEVIAPQMPNKQNAKYEEWKIWFEKYLPLIGEDVLLVGHSLGGSFLVKYLSENRVPKNIRGTFIVAAPYDVDGDHTLIEFGAPSSLALLAEQGGQLFFYQSKDDPVVDFGELAKYRVALPHAHFEEFADREHFQHEEFPELVRDIKSL